MKFLGTAALALFSMSVTAATDSAHMFSADMLPEMEMHTFDLSERAIEDNSLIQVVASKTVTADCNVRSLNVSFEKKSLEGWGYPYFVASESPVMGTTLLPCDAEEKVLETARGELYRYNSKVPLVIYAPADLEISYRVWSVEE